MLTGDVEITVLMPDNLVRIANINGADYTLKVRDTKSGEILEKIIEARHAAKILELICNCEADYGDVETVFNGVPQHLRCIP